MIFRKVVYDCVESGCPEIVYMDRHFGSPAVCEDDSIFPEVKIHRKIWDFPQKKNIQSSIKTDFYTSCTFTYKTGRRKLYIAVYVEVVTELVCL